MKNFIEVYDNALTSDQCNSIIDYTKNSTRMRRGAMGMGVDLSKKDSWDVYMLFSEKTDVDRMINSVLCEYLKDYKIKNPELNTLGYWGIENRYNLQMYLPGGGYPQPHCEQSSREFSERMLVWMIYLNDVTDDGGTNFPQHNLITDAVAGRLVVWPAAWTHFHHGIVSKTQMKCIATGWFSFVP